MGYDKIKLEVGDVTDGDGEALQDEAIIFFSGDDGSSEIKINAPHAMLIAQRIVSLWNGGGGIS